jgi:hypothetical protein
VQQEQTHTGWLRRWPPVALTQAVRELRQLVARQEAMPVSAGPANPGGTFRGAGPPGAPEDRPG